jgi:hypothetical protein
MEALNKALQQSSQEMYQATQQPNAAAGAKHQSEPQPTHDSQEAMEAEYEEVE